MITGVHRVLASGRHAAECATHSVVFLPCTPALGGWDCFHLHIADGEVRGERLGDVSGSHVWSGRAGE